MQQPKQQKQQKKQMDQQLVDLPEDAPQKSWMKTIITPKFIILFVVAALCVIRNIYLNMTAPINTDQTKPQKQYKQTQVSPQILQRFYGYLIVSAIFLVIFILLKRSNDKAQEQRIRQQIRKQQEQQNLLKNTKSKFQEKAMKIAASMDMFGNVIAEENNQQSMKKQQTKEENEQNNQNEENRKDK